MALPVSQSDMVKQQQELQKQRMIELRRLAKQKYGPAVDGILWHIGKPEDRPRTPILSVLTFKFKPNVDILDTSQAPRKFWDSSIQYVWSIPGCMSIEWGQALEEPTNVLCMIQWDSAIAWQKFQQSLGFELIVGLLVANVSNRCLKFQPANVIALGDNEAVQEEILVTFGADTSLAFRKTFEVEWRGLIASFTNESLLSARSGWLEQSASTFREPTADEVAATSRVPVAFVGFLAWKSAGYDSQKAVLLSKAIGDKVPEEVHWSLSRTARNLIQEDLNDGAFLLSLPVSPIDSMASILKAGIQRKFSKEHHAWHVFDKYAFDSVEAVRQGNRQFPSPWGFYTLQGELCQDNMPIIPQLHNHPHFTDRDFVVDIVWFHFNLDARPFPAPDVDVAKVFHSLDDEISQISGYEAGFWALDVYDQTTAALITVWQDQDARAASAQQYYQVIEVYVASSDHLAAQPEYQAFPFKGVTHLKWIQYLELTSFYVPSGEDNQQLFEQAYMAFERTTMLHTNSAIRTACRFTAGGGWQPAALPDRDPVVAMQRFTGILSWVDPVARSEWYGELSTRSASSYELFGHKLDALKILAAGGIESRLVVLQPGFDREE